MKLGRIFFHHHVEGYKSVKASGLDFVEICCNYDKDNDYVVGEKERFKSVIEESGVEVACLGRWNHELLKDGKIDYARVDYYKELLDTGVITQEEFDAKKKELLGL